MADAGMKITIGADVQQAVSAMRAFVGEVGTGAGTISASSGEIVTSLKSVADAADLPAGSMAELKQIIKSLEGEIENFNQVAGDPKGLQALSSELALAKAELAQMQTQAGLTGRALGTTVSAGASQASGAMGGFLNTNSKARVAFLDLGRVVTDQGFSLRSLASNFALFPPILVVTAAAIGGLIYLFTRQTEAEKQAAEAAAQHKKAVEDLIFTFSDSTRVQDEANAQTQGQIANVKALALVAEDANKPYAERKRALSDLKEINKSYFGDLSLEADKLGVLKKAVDDYTQALIQQAIIKGFSEEIAKVAVAMSTQQKEVDKAKTKYEQLDAAAKAAAKSVADVNPDVVNVGGTGVTADVAGFTEAVQKAAAAQKDFVDKRTDLEKLNFQYADLQDEIDKAVEASLKFKNLKTDKSGDTALNKEIEDIKKEIAALEQLQKQGEITTVELESLFNLKIKLITVELPKTKLSEGQAQRLIIDLQNQADQALASNPLDLRIKFANVITGTPSNTNAFDLQAALKKQFDVTALTKSIPLKADVTINPNLILDAKGINFKKLENQFAGLSDSIAKIAKKAIEDGLANIGTVIGDVITGTNLKDGLAAFASILGEGLIEVGKIVIEYAIAIEGIKTAIKNLIKTPAGAVIAIGLGIAAIALGTALKNKVSNVTAFADGGIVTGPTNALIGERGPEVVFPLRELNKFVKGISGGNTEPIVLGTTLRGDDIYISQQRVARRRDRV